MLSKYFIMKTQTSDFKASIETIFENYADKKVIIYGAGEGFVALNKRYKFNKKFSVVAIADKKFEACKPKEFKGFKPIEPNEICNEVYDVILITNETNAGIKNFLVNTLSVDENKIVTIFNEDVKDGQTNYNYLEQFKFGKNLPKLIKKLKNKSVVIYGAGAYFELIRKYYNLDGLNIIGIADGRFYEHEEGETKFGYKVYSPDELRDVNPDYVVVATKFYINIIENLYCDVLKGTKIKVKPLVKKSFRVLLKEIWG